MKLLNDNTGRKKTEACGMTKDQMIEAMRKINAKYNDNLCYCSCGRFTH